VKRHIILFFILLSVLFSCTEKTEIPVIPQNNLSISIDLDSIVKRGRLIAVSDFNSTNYFVYKGEPMGFHYEMLKQFTEHIGVDLEIIRENNPEKAVQLLNSGKADLLALGFTVNSSAGEAIQFTEPIYETRQMLVQRKPDNWRSMTAEALDRHLIRNQLDLAGKTVYVQEYSSHADRMRSLAREIGDSVSIIEVPYDSEELIRNVADGIIEYTVSNENVAHVNSTFYNGIDINTPVSFPRYVVWGVRKEGSDRILEEFNRWVNGYRSSKSYAFLYAKYFKNSRSRIIVKSDYYTFMTGRISKYDELIKSASAEIGWDWRLLASLIYQESRFNPGVESRAGAYGLMQVMPGTGKRFGIDITSSTENNVKAGISYIRWLQSLYESKVTDENERIKFILASYNAGQGHVLDAIRLAGKNGMDPQKWNGSVEVWIQKKAEPQYYKDPVVRSGYFKGKETVNYVSEVLERYEHYKNIIPEEPKLNLTWNSRRAYVSIDSLVFID